MTDDAEKLARKHRAEGLREAANMAENLAMAGCVCDRCSERRILANRFNSRADAIERGEA